ncbi:nitroreductase family protein [Candidatus Bathyarchaeota archaeon]|nr:nitroreductase family protein [Candidatus Bathyarchaeota archaeon]
MEVLEAIRRRRSVRSYLETPVPDDLLYQLLEAARLAPSAANIQPWHFIIVKDKEKRAKIANCCSYGRFLVESPIVIVGCGDEKASPRWYAIDTSIALENLIIAATGLGLGTCWIGSFDEGKLASLLQLPRNLRVIALVSVGYSRERKDLGARLLHAIRPRKRLDEIVSLETYGKAMQWNLSTTLSPKEGSIN